MNDRQARQAICRAGAHLSKRGLSPGTSGNISVRLDDGGWIVTPTNAALGSLDADSLSLIAGDAHASGDAPTKERFLHAAIYDAIRDGDPEAAAAATGVHLDRTLEDYRREIQRLVFG